MKKIIAYALLSWYITLRTVGIVNSKYFLSELCKFQYGPWWRHQIETFSALMALWVGNSPVTDEFPSQRPVTRSFDVYIDLGLNKWLIKQSRRWWFETPSCPLWCHCNVIQVWRIQTKLKCVFVLRILIWNTCVVWNLVAVNFISFAYWEAWFRFCIMKSNNLEIFKEVSDIGWCLKCPTFRDYISFGNFRSPS